MAQQITSRPGLFIAGYTALALALGALVIALRGYDFLLFILIWPVILRAYPNNPAARTAITPQAKRLQFCG